MDELKPWQKGFSLDYLKSIETHFAAYNKFAYSPFTKYTKNQVAEDLAAGKLFLYDDNENTACVIQRVKVKSSITCYHDVEIAWKHPGDVVVSHLLGNSTHIANIITPLSNEHPTWVYTWGEDATYNSMLESLGFKWIGGKFASSSELYAIWFKDCPQDDIFGAPVHREFPQLDPIEQIALKKIGSIDLDVIESIKSKLEDLDLQFSKSDLTAYVNKDWSALSLRGYSPDYKFIADPNEMSKKWNEKHKGETFELQDTSLYDEFPMVRQLIEDLFPNVECHRVAFMRMKAHGVLTRHTDMICPFHGLAIGKLVRFHIPIKTYENVRFLSWNFDGSIIDEYMRIGEYYVIDTRKAHSVVANSDEERIHLTIDLMMVSNIREMILK